ncbi:hypothetical protein ACFLQN_03965 [Candidatus Aenigmatarchaeota archaeon]
MSRYGQLILVSGPSGSGKSTLLDGVRDYNGLQVPRLLTSRSQRPSDCGKDEYVFEDPATYADAITWESHGHRYGVRGLGERLYRGGSTIIPVSISSVPEFRRLFPNVTSVFLDAPDELLAERIYSRRDNGLALVRRKMLDAVDERGIRSESDTVVVNDSSVGHMMAGFFDVLHSR